MGRNKLVKSAHVSQDFDINQIEEVRRCIEGHTDPKTNEHMIGPIYFIRNYVRVQHPKLGDIPLLLFPYQEKMIQAFYERDKVIVLSARQTGKSVCSSAFLLWFSIFNSEKTILIAANKNANAMEMIARIQYMYTCLPDWLKPGVVEGGWNKHELKFDNNSRIISTATSGSSGRGLSISLLYLDEFAFVNPSIQEEFWTSVLPTLSTGGACIITSTPNGAKDLFATIWRSANTSTTDDSMPLFFPIQVRWDEPPGRDEKFKQAQIELLGKLKWDQEYECCSTDTRITLMDQSGNIFEISMEELFKDLKGECFD